MNGKQMRGALLGIAARFEEHAGNLLGNPEMQRRGAHKRRVAHTVRMAGDAREAIKAALRRH